MAAFLAWLSSFLTQFGYALVKGAVTGDLKPPPAVMTDVHADPGVQKELQDDLEQQITGGGT